MIWRCNVRIRAALDAMSTGWKQATLGRTVECVCRPSLPVIDAALCIVTTRLLHITEIQAICELRHGTEV